MGNKLNIERFCEAWAAALSYDLSIKVNRPIEVTVTATKKEVKCDGKKGS